MVVRAPVSVGEHPSAFRGAGNIFDQSRKPRCLLHSIAQGDILCLDPRRAVKGCHCDTPTDRCRPPNEDNYIGTILTVEIPTAV